MSIGYGWEKLHGAVFTLCGEGTQPERLVGAIGHFSMLNPESHLPEEIRDEFKKFMEKMKSVPSKGGEGNIQATVDELRKENPEEVRGAVEKILEFYDEVCRHMKPRSE